MNIDLTKLSPAPWGDDWHSIEGCCSETDSAFIALARSAFDVMLRRGWWAVPCADGRWLVRAPDAALDRMHGPVEADDVRYPDPFTALVGADRWMTEQEYARGCTRVAQPQEST